MGDASQYLDNMPEFDRKMSSEKIAAILETEREHVVMFTKSVQEFSDMDIDTKLALLSNSWNILVITAIAHRSQSVNERDHLTLMMASGDELHPGSLLAEKIGINERNFGLILHQTLPMLLGANVDDFEAHSLMSFKLLCNADDSILHRLCNEFYEHCKRQVSDDSWRDRAIDILYGISDSLENIAHGCTMHKHLLFPDNQPLEPFLLEKLREADQME